MIGTLFVTLILSRIPHALVCGNDIRKSIFGIHCKNLIRIPFGDDKTAGHDTMDGGTERFWLKRLSTGSRV